MEESDESVLFADYYYGLYENPRLLARSNPAPWTIPRVTGSKILVDTKEVRVGIPKSCAQ
jgi:hypothetical protein